MSLSIYKLWNKLILLQVHEDEVVIFGAVPVLQVACISELLQFLVSCMAHVTLTSLVCDNIKTEARDTWLGGRTQNTLYLVSSIST